MPILPPEPDRYPSDLFDTDSPADSDRVWRVLHTYARQEKSLVRSLFQAQVPYYLPTVAQRRQGPSRVRLSHLPLFPNYVFLLSNAEERVVALATNRVVRAIEVVDQVGLQEDLRQICRLLDAGVPVRPEDRLAPGVAVEVRSGPLAGLRGTIVRTSSGRRFVVQVNFIQQGASVLVEDWNLAAVEEEPILQS